MGFLSKLLGGKEMVARISGPGTFDFDIVGESHYQKALAKICGGKTQDGHRKKVVARIYHDDRNPYDNQAVRVEINGETVGHFDREGARSFREQLRVAGHPGAIAECDAIIVGGWSRGRSDSGQFGVKLDLPLDDDGDEVAGERAVRDPVLDRHFELLESIKLQYRKRDTEPGALGKAIAACEAQIALSLQAAEAFKLHYSGAKLPSHTGYKQLAIIHEKSGELEAAINLCAEAKYRGWAGDWDKRIDRCTKRLAKQGGTKAGSIPALQSKAAEPAEIPSESPLTPFVARAIQVVCPTCSRQLNIPVKYAGTRGNCNHCKGVILVPGPSSG